jgi:transposase
MVDGLGLLWGRQVTSANTSDQEGFRQTFVSILPCVLGVTRVYADRGYRGRLAQWLIAVTGAHCLLEVIEPIEGQKGFAVQPKRWIVERTISWLNWSRRLSKDYEQTVASSQAWIDVSAIRGNLRKITA